MRGLLAKGLLVALLLGVPAATARDAPAVLVGTGIARGVDHDRGTVWILALGSDARPGQPVDRQRADAIQMVGVDLEAGRAVSIGVPRDSWVPIPGRGSGRVNSALTYGGPELMGRTVGNLVGVQPDYVFLTSFTGFREMVRSIGGITVNSRLAFDDPNMEGAVRRGANQLDPWEALFFSRARYELPRGDFDRSANQQELLRAILRRVRERQNDPGFMERALVAVAANLDTDLSPTELYRLAHALTAIDPATMPTCVLDGRYGTVGGASIIFPDVGQARRLGNDARNDARFDTGC
jgi:LCP family protein required for cell wall assembly